jgi:transposase-like protein
METVFVEKKAPVLEEVTASPTGDQSGSEGGAVEAMTGLGLAGRPPDPEVVERPARRRFSAEYKLRILREADGCTKTGEIGALMRREGLYSSHLTEWRRARELGELGALGPKKRGRKATRHDPLVKENERLRKEKAALERKVKQIETLLDIQKKVSELLGIPLNPPGSEGNDS